ncbi:DUF305 domain-containing protein [Nocardiopsis dassonvillei subsp. albirubida]|uniref:DUF305 domain-containing protein n=2 Tax=Nocardiopsidaceae TaxID=83676 RepID=A0A7X6RQR8_9ACTN|nr:DUF305 domain-containing protein [Nocardiopsis alborubida]
MAQTELDEGVNPEARELVQEVIDAQRAESEQMKEMLGTEGRGSGDVDGASPRRRDTAGTDRPDRSRTVASGSFATSTTFCHWWHVG